MKKKAEKKVEVVEEVVETRVKIKRRARDEILAEMAALAETEKKLSSKRVRKGAYKEKLQGLLSKYENILICGIDNVGSNQMQKVRIELRGKAEILCGKNTIIRKVVREEGESNPKLAGLLPLVWGNVSLVFTNEDLNEVRQLIVANKVPAAAKVGAFAPQAVVVPPGPTGLDPGQTAFFQVLNIGTKIAKGSIEIINAVDLLKVGDKVTASAVALLDKLGIRPFHYGISVDHVYQNGSVFSAKVLALGEDDLIAKFLNAVRFLAALSLATGYPTEASIPHSIVGAFHRLLAISQATAYSFKEAKMLS